MIDTANCVADAIYRLGFADAADLASNGQGLTADELYSYADDAARILCYQSGLFVVLDNSIAVTAGTALYAEPDSHVYTIAAWVDTDPLRLTPVRNLWALDATWSLTVGPVSRASMDAGGVGTITLYPIPDADGTLYQICQQAPATIALGASTVSLPTVLQDYLTYFMLAGARGGEWVGVQQEMADHYKRRCDMYEAVIAKLWGAGG